MKLYTGQMIAEKYKVKELIAHSQSSSVYLVTDPNGIEVAAKLIPHEREEKFGLYEKETRLLRDVSHKNIVRLIDAGRCREHKIFYIITEYIFGNNLKDHLHQIGSPGERLNKGLQLLSDILSALHYLHTANYLHKDIKPSNIMVDADGRPCLMDFGISRVLETITTTSETDFYSPAYVTPEQLKKQKLTPMTDMYQLGISFLESFGEEVLFREYLDENLDLNEFVDSACEGFQAYGDEIVNTLRDMFRKMLMLNPENRYQNTRDLNLDVNHIKSLLPFKRVYEICCHANVVEALKNEIPDVYADYDVKNYLEKSLNAGETYAELNDKGERLHIDITTDDFMLKADVSNDGSHLFTFAFYSNTDDRVRRFGIKVEDVFRVTPSTRPVDNGTSDAIQLMNYLVREKNIKNKKNAAQKKERDFLEKSDTFLKIERELYEKKKFPPLRYELSEHLRGDHKIRLRIIDPAKLEICRQNIREDRLEKLIQRLKSEKLIMFETNFSLEDVIKSLNILISDKNFLSKNRNTFFRQMDDQKFRRFQGLYESFSETRKREEHAYILVKYFSDGLNIPKSDVILPEPGIEAGLFKYEDHISPELVGTIDQINESKPEILFDYDPERAAKIADDKVLPKEGFLKQFSMREESLLKKQEYAMRDLKAKNTLASDLLAKLSRIELMAPKSETTSLTQYYDSSLDDNQREAVSKCLALQSGEFMCIQGPPGTGKTTVITEVVKQILGRYQKAKILVASQSNQAVDNVLEKLKEHEGVYLARLGINEAVISDNVKEYTYNAVSKKMLDKIITNIKATEKTFEEYLENPDENEKLQALRSSWIKQLKGRNDELERILLKNINVLFATLVGIANKQYSFLNERFDYVIIDEAGRATLPELAICMNKARHIILVGDHKQLPPVFDEEAMQEILKKMPDQNRKDIEKTLFEDLFIRLQEKRNSYCHFLSNNYRMHPDICMLVSEVFYDHKLSTPGIVDRPHNLDYDFSCYWYTTEALQNRAEKAKGNGRYYNPENIDQILSLLEKIEHQCQNKDLIKTVGVITPYREEGFELRQKIKPNDKTRWEKLSIEIATVHKFQGSDEDIIIFDTVRSNPGKKLGFISDAHQLNVALSRAKEMLFIVGDADCAYSGKSTYENPYTKVIDVMRKNRDRYGWVRLGG